MDKVISLPNVQRISERVLRILGQNPGKFTLQGTNTYLVGTQPPFILIDTAQGVPEYATLFESTLKDLARPSTPLISDVIISHWHRDHVDGLSDVLAILHRLWKDDTPYQPPRLHKWPLAVDPNETINGSPNTLPAILETISPSLYTPSSTGPFHALAHDQILTSPGGTLRVLHTPGHTEDSIALLVEEDQALYTADSVLGQGTAVFEDLAAYIASLRLMLEDKYSYEKLYPGHGPVIEEKGRATIEEYIHHRMLREAQIVDILKAVAKITLWDIVKKIYADYPEKLWLPAAHGVNLHLEKLRKEGKAQPLGGEGVHTEWAWVSLSGM